MGLLLERREQKKKSTNPDQKLWVQQRGHCKGIKQIQINGEHFERTRLKNLIFSYHWHHWWAIWWWFSVVDSKRRIFCHWCRWTAQLVHFLIDTIMFHSRNGNNRNHKILPISINFNWTVCLLAILSSKCHDNQWICDIGFRDLMVILGDANCVCVSVHISSVLHALQDDPLPIKWCCTTSMGNE